MTIYPIFAVDVNKADDLEAIVTKIVPDAYKGSSLSFLLIIIAIFSKPECI
jgi:hypothetical protein